MVRYLAALACVLVLPVSSAQAAPSGGSRDKAEEAGAPFADCARREGKERRMGKVKTHLTFQGNAEKAVDLYSSVFKDFHVRCLEKYGEGEQVAAGSFKLAHVSFAGHELIVFDSPPVHNFSFTPSMSIYVDFETPDDLEAAFGTLSQDEEVMMPLDDYGFSKRFGWVADRYGVSWQLNLPR